MYCSLLIKTHGEAAAKQRKRGKDGARVKRMRTCKRCNAWGVVEQGQKCKGRTMKGVGACEHFKQDPPEEKCYTEGEGEGEEGGGEEQDDE